ncbi:MAG: VCBS repeat-containing protein [Pseudomonadota bacterium]
MIIASSDVLLASSRSFTSQRTIQEKTRAWIGDQRPDFAGEKAPQAPAQPTPPPPAAIAHLSDAGKAAQAGEASALDKVPEEVENDPRVRLIKSMLEYMLGIKINSLKAADFTPANAAEIPVEANQEQAAAAPPAPNPRQGWGLEFERHETYQEAERTTFQAAGVIRTADNREIKFQLSFELQRSYSEESNISVRQGDAKQVDPLVLNFSGNAVQLTSQKFAFDLNGDGTKENISFVQGAGFLALDSNGDGIINDGKELFGPNTGNGFTELKALDSDGNNWIDENDPAFQQLQVWTKDAAGVDQLSSLKDSNVGALYLGNVSTAFSINDAKNTPQAQLVSSGLWLTEDGKVNTLQQIDLVA